MDGPRIYYLWLPGLVDPNWAERALYASGLGFDWLYLGGVEAVIPSASDPQICFSPDSTKLGNLSSPEKEPKDRLLELIRAAHEAGLNLVTDFTPSFVERSSSLVGLHPDWWIADPHGQPAIPSGMNAKLKPERFAETDFQGPRRDELVDFWRAVASERLALGFDALVCRFAWRLDASTWSRILNPLREAIPETQFWADTLGTQIEASESLAQANFDAFFSSFCWWNFEDDWFYEQEERLKRMAPTVGFPQELWVEDQTTMETALGGGQSAQLLIGYQLAAMLCWGAILPAATERGSMPSDSHGHSTLQLRDLTSNLVAINKLKSDLGGALRNSYLLRLSRDGTLAVGCIPNDPSEQPVLVLSNPATDRTVTVAAGPLFGSLDVASARAMEVTPGRSPQKLNGGSKVSLDPLETRIFRISAPRLKARAVSDPPIHQEPISINLASPHLEGGRYPIKRLTGEIISVTAKVFAEGHGQLNAVIEVNGPRSADTYEVPLLAMGNDWWLGEFVPDTIGNWKYRIMAWRDRFVTWREDCIKRRDAGQLDWADLNEGVALLRQAFDETEGTNQLKLGELVERCKYHEKSETRLLSILLNETTAELVSATLARDGASYSRWYRASVERARAGAGAWYEVFPRSLGVEGEHGSFRDLMAALPRIAKMGFDILYLPPIHPIGRVNRKGQNNALMAAPGDPGSPWAIGSAEGGHLAVHPELGTLSDFRELTALAKYHGLEVAMDFALQCAPDHPWIKAHPEWFSWRTDGTIRHAENPPKKYEDIVNFNFYCECAADLWVALRDVALYWCEQGIRIFRVDNPHTKPFPFWEWLLDNVRRRFPDTVFLSEAFTRPGPMRELAKLGFSQSYTYFTWRNTKSEIMDYLKELTTEASLQYFRPNFWVNTPDINPHYLHHSGRAGFVIRAVLAATLSPSWGIYSGYELCESSPLLNEDGTEREEYLDSEKYQYKHRQFDQPGNIISEISSLNRIRRAHPALRKLGGLKFLDVADDQVLFYERNFGGDRVWIVVCLDPHFHHQVHITFPADLFEEGARLPVALEELLSGEIIRCDSSGQSITLGPEKPAMIMTVRRLP